MLSPKSWVDRFFSPLLAVVVDYDDDYNYSVDFIVLLDRRQLLLEEASLCFLEPSCTNPLHFWPLPG